MFTEKVQVCRQLLFSGHLQDEFSARREHSLNKRNKTAVPASAVIYCMCNVLSHRFLVGSARSQNFNILTRQEQHVTSASGVSDLWETLS
jgi:hypothetical protein